MTYGLTVTSLDGKECQMAQRVIAIYDVYFAGKCGVSQTSDRNDDGHSSVFQFI